MQSPVDRQDARYARPTRSKLHVAIIMDGNGRWAARRGLPRTAGHQAGLRAARRVVKAAPDLGVTLLTLFAFSSDNWRRPRAEVRAAASRDGAFAVVSALMVVPQWVNWDAWRNLSAVMPRESGAPSHR